jgi:hypothetical protein
LILDFAITKGQDGINGEDDTCDTTCTNGDKGNAPDVIAGTTTTVPPASPATVNNVGNETNAILDFEVPKGETGDDGSCPSQCVNGSAPNCVAGTVTTVPPGDPATVVDSGTPGNVIFDYEIPKGVPGDDAVCLEDCSNGTTISASVGTTTSVPYYVPSSVTNSGTPFVPVLDFEITKGFSGANASCPDPCVNGTNGTITTIVAGTVTTVSYADPAAVINSGTSSDAVLDFEIPRGIPGENDTCTTTCVNGTVATAVAGTTADVSTPSSVTNSGTSAAAVLDFEITRGEPGANVTCPDPCINGTDGDSVTIVAGTTTTVETLANVTNTGTSTSAILDFEIAKGFDGANATCPSQCVDGAAPTIVSGTTTFVSSATPADVTNSGTSTSATFNYDVPQGFAGTAGINASIYNYSYIATVDAVFGNDTTAVIGTGSQRPLPWKTIRPALAAATALASSSTPVVVYMYPGNYDGYLLNGAFTTSGLVISSYVTVRGVDRDAVKIQSIRVTAPAAQAMISMNALSHLRDISLEIRYPDHTPTSGNFIQAINFLSGGCGATVQNVNITIDNSPASSGGTSNVQAISLIGAGGCDAGNSVINVVDTTITVLSAGFGSKRGMYMFFTVSSPIVVRMTRCYILVDNPNVSPTGNDFVGIDARGSTGNATIYASFSRVFGYTADVAALNSARDSVYLYETYLEHSTVRSSTGLGIFSQSTPKRMEWGDPGVIPSTTGFMRFGSGTISAANEIAWDVSSHFLASLLTVRCVVAPSIGESVVFTARKNGANTLLAATLTASNFFVSNAANAITYNTGDRISMRVAPSGVTTTADCVVAVSMY